MSEKPTYSAEFLNHIKQIHNKRAKIVVDHIMRHGFITTEDLENTYGYKHPPRAARDVREAGIPLETFSVKSGRGKTIAAYRFGDLSASQAGRIKGRILLPALFRKALYDSSGGKCTVCGGVFERRYLQVDHKVPYEVGGDSSGQPQAENFMLLCGSCNRAKSWSCEHCGNWQGEKNVEVCKTCYWGNPSDYDHIALKNVRRLDLLWEGKDVGCYDVMKVLARNKGVALPDFVKQILKNTLKDHEPV